MIVDTQSFPRAHYQEMHYELRRAEPNSNPA